MTLSRRNTSRARRALRKGVAMITISIKRVYDKPSSRDGVRILVDRLWPRGMSKDAAALDLWCKELAPTPALRTWFDHRSDRFAEFKGRYLLELRSNPAVPDLVSQIGTRRATLLYGAKNRAVNHAVVLAGYLESYGKLASRKRG
ncbi:hypothetical protein BSZ19_18425 [Bradyrhizobium japonicum]|uniref:DUF488 domain-containing protein n=2 Tax=Bradyrhizobium japonicum TaxID=375 RepID=A0A1Y2JNS9_BRAJP|nr:hypothetical protein BSZ19_18425 [Bradyrhizobium japonicum]